MEWEGWILWRSPFVVEVTGVCWFMNHLIFLMGQGNEGPDNGWVSEVKIWYLGWAGHVGDYIMKYVPPAWGFLITDRDIATLRMRKKDGRRQ